MNWIYDPWPWFIGGPLIALVMLLLLLSEKKFGMSSNLRTICAAFGAGKSTPFFDYDWKSQRWNIIVVLGAFARWFDRIAIFILPNLLLNYILMSSFNCKNSTSSDAGQAYMPETLFGEHSLDRLEVLINFSRWWISGWLWSSLCWWLYLGPCDFRFKQPSTPLVDCSHRIFYWGNYYESLSNSLYIMRTMTYFFIGILFGITLFKSEAASWFRIYEMFQFKSFHMYGIIGSALVLGVFITQSIKRFKIKSFYGQPIVIARQRKDAKKQLYTEALFWAGLGTRRGLSRSNFCSFGSRVMYPVLVLVFLCYPWALLSMANSKNDFHTNQ